MNGRLSVEVMCFETESTEPGDDSEGIAKAPFLIRARSVAEVHPGPTINPRGSTRRHG